jgi:hypothetical protein
MGACFAKHVNLPEEEIDHDSTQTHRQQESRHRYRYFHSLFKKVKRRKKRNSCKKNELHREKERLTPAFLLDEQTKSTTSLLGDVVHKQELLVTKPPRPLRPSPPLPKYARLQNTFKRRSCTV